MTSKELSNLITTGRKLKKFIKETLPKIREEFQSHSNSGIDKHTDGFDRKESIQSMNINNLCYSSFSGNYGNGNTFSDIANMDTDLMQKYFIKYLNKHKDEKILVIADGAAFGSEIHRVLRLIENRRNVVLYLPESFEWMILKAGVLKNSQVEKLVNDPSEFVESSEYFSWERFFTAVLIEATKDTYLAYAKKN